MARSRPPLTLRGWDSALRVAIFGSGHLVAPTCQKACLPLHPVGVACNGLWGGGFKQGRGAYSTLRLGTTTYLSVCDSTCLLLLLPCWCKLAPPPSSSLSGAHTGTVRCLGHQLPEIGETRGGKKNQDYHISCFLGYLWFCDFLLMVTASYRSAAARRLRVSPPFCPPNFCSAVCASGCHC